MNNLNLEIVINNNEVKITSLQIAEVTDKRHDNIMRDIRKIKETLINAGLINALNYELVKYKDNKGELRPCYTLTKDETMHIMTKYDDIARFKVIAKMRELEQELQKTNMPSYQITDPVERALKWAEEEKQRQLLLQDNKKKEEKILQDKPRVDFAEAIEESSDSITVGQFAKLLANDGIKLGRHTLFSWLRDNGYLIKFGKEKNNPKQKYVEMSIFEVKESAVNTVKGEILTTKTLITGKGQLYLISKIKESLKDGGESSEN